MRDRFDDVVSITVDLIKAETDAAFLCEIDGDDMWLPKSQIKNADEYEKGDEDIEMEITRWIAEQKNLGD